MRWEPSRNAFGAYPVFEIGLLGPIFSHYLQRQTGRPAPFYDQKLFVVRFGKVVRWEQLQQPAFAPWTYMFVTAVNLHVQPTSLPRCKSAGCGREAAAVRMQCTAASCRIYLSFLLNRGWSNQPLGCPEINSAQCDCRPGHPAIVHWLWLLWSTNLLTYLLTHHYLVYKMGWDEGCGPQPCGFLRKWPAATERLDSTDLVYGIFTSSHAKYRDHLLSRHVYRH